MGSLFGKPKSPKQSRVTEQDKAVLQLKQQRDKIKQYQKKIQSQLEKERTLAKKLLNDGKKEKAMTLLRKKRFQEKMLARADGQLENIERMVSDIEFAQIEAKVMDGLKSGNEALRSLHQLMSIEDVEKILDDTQEAVAYQKEIDDLLAGGLSQEDEDDVLAELDAIVQGTKEPAAAQSLDVELPDVPTDPIKDKEKEKTRQKEAVLAS